MATPNAAAGETTTTENFAALLEESYGASTSLEGTVIPGWVVAIENDVVLIDVGLKSEGRVALREFGSSQELKVGDRVEVYLERIENVHGDAVLSREKARREEAWTVLEKAFQANERVQGTIFGRVKGGFTVDLSGAVAFLPGSQVDIRPVRDIGPLMGTPQPFQILKMDRRRGNIVVSRRAVLEETRAEVRSGLVASLREGQVLEGVVKNITDYGAFVDLGGIDGLLHVTDIAWRRINHPSEVLRIGETVKVQVIRVNPETQRISLGMKQLEEDPWQGVQAKYPVGTRFTGRVTNITDYGAFVELEPGVEGLVHVSEMSWTKKNVHPGKIVSTSQEVEVMVLDVDPVKRRVSLGLKQVAENPWEGFREKYPPGSVIEGEVKSITEFGVFIGLPGEIDGMVHLSDLDWNAPGDQAVQKYKKGENVRAKVLDIDVAKERISLGVKQLDSDPFEAVATLKKGDTVTCTISAVRENGIDVSIGEGVHGFIRRADLARDRSEQRPDRFAVGDKVDAMVTSVERDSRRLTLSVKAREIADEKAAMEQYGSTDSGASLGDILGAAMDKRAREAAKTADDDKDKE
ncbi:MAG: 30S ribosomal protein S1 [Alphaproteobacteria bacterium]|nr:30S ribosomal protein S1 [Alphaproteobacteria bacterium]